MKLPSAQKAIVPKSKITDYLLCLTHTNGHSKAKFFLNHGFSLADWQEMAEALKDLAQRNEVINVEKTPFGMRYVIDGKINTPNQRNPFIRTVWFIEDEQTIPIFVTAYPQQE
jgi:hypothetical protein